MPKIGAKLSKCLLLGNLAIFFCLLLGPAKAGFTATNTTIVKGNITSATTGKGISKATISVYNGSSLLKSGYSDSKGAYSLTFTLKKTINAEVTAKAGNYVTQSKTQRISPNVTYTVNFRLSPLPDTAPPTGSITINNNAAYTKSTSVILNLSASDSGSGVSQMQFSNNGSNWSNPEAYASTRSWTLSPGDAAKTVSVKYRDVSGNWSAAFRGTIILDTAAPSITINPATSPTNQNVTLTYILSDNLTPQNQITVSGDNSPYTQEGTYNVTLTAQDLAGNIRIQTVSFVIDKTPPTGNILINNGNQYTNSYFGYVTLNLSYNDTGGSGVDKMSFSSTGDTWTQPRSCAGTYSWSLTAGDGEKTVYVKFLDKAGNWSEVFSDNIIKDSQPPSTPVITLEGTSTRNKTQLRCRWASVDAGSGIAECQYKIMENSPISGARIVDWVSAGTLTEIMHSGLNLVPGKKYFFVIKTRDNAGLWSFEQYSDGIEIITGPSAPVVTDDGEYTSLSSQLHFSWSASDPDSTITEYQYSIGTQPGSPNLVDWTLVNTPEITVTGLELSPYYRSYYCNVRAKNAEGFWSPAGQSDGIRYNRTPEISYFNPTDKTAFMENDVINIYACAKDSDGDKPEFQLYIDGRIIVPWSNQTGSCNSYGPGSSFAYNWQTKIGDAGFHKIKVEVRDNKVEPVYQELTIFLYHRPTGPPS